MLFGGFGGGLEVDFDEDGVDIDPVIGVGVGFVAPIVLGTIGRVFGGDRRGNDRQNCDRQRGCDRRHKGSGRTIQ